MSETLNPDKRTLLGTQKMELQEYIRNIIGIYLAGSLNLILPYSWSSPVLIPGTQSLLHSTMNLGFRVYRAGGSGFEAEGVRGQDLGLRI